MGFLERMREKPQHVKGQYAFLSALSFTLVVALIWGLSLPARLSNTGEIAKESSDSKERSFSLNSFFTSAQTQIANLVDTVKESTKEPEQTIPAEEIATEEATMLSEPEVQKDSYSVSTSSGEILIIENSLPDEMESEPELEPRVVLIATTSKKKATSSEEGPKPAD